MNETVVVDINVIISCLISNNRAIRSIISEQEHVSFVTPAFGIVELFKHFEKIKKISRLHDGELLNLLSIIVNQIKFHQESAVTVGSWVEANRLCHETDENDLAYVALAIELDARLWTRDEELKRGLIKKGFDRFYEP